MSHDVLYPSILQVWTSGPWGAKAWGRRAPLGFLQDKLHTHTHTHVNCHCHVLGQLPENKTKSPPGSPHPVLFENKHVIVYDVNYSSIGNELRVSNSFRMGHFIAEGSLGLWVLAKNHVSSSDRRQRELGLKANFSASGLCWEVERTQEPWGFNLPNLRQILLSPSILGPSAVKQGNGT